MHQSDQPGRRDDDDIVGPVNDRTGYHGHDHRTDDDVDDYLHDRSAEHHDHAASGIVMAHTRDDRRC